MPRKSRASKKNRKLRIILDIIKSVISFITNRKILPIIIILSLGSWVYYSGEYDKLIQKIDSSQNKLTDKLGLTVKDILLSGQVNTSKEDILNIFNSSEIYIEDDVDNNSVFNIDLAKAKEKLEELVWVHYASIERQYPSTISINIIEYKPIALWQKKGNIFLINEEGEVINEKDISKFSDLIIMVGDDVPTYASALLKMINSQPDIAGLVSSAIRVSNRRWDLKLNNGIRIKLPETNPQKAWDYLAKTHDETGILASDIKQIDLRIEEKMFVL